MAFCPCFLHHSFYNRLIIAAFVYISVLVAERDSSMIVYLVLW